MNLYIFIVCILFIILFISIYFVLFLRHYPRHKLSNEITVKIKMFVLMHFTKKENIESILAHGLQAGKRDPMYYLEKDMVWMYIADPVTFDAKLKEIHSKGDRKSYDVVIFIDGFSENQLSKMRYRKKPEAVVHIGTLKTENMIFKELLPFKI